MTFKNKELQKAEPVGMNTVDHYRRTKLGLNCTEYCVLDTIFQRKRKGKYTQFVSIEVFTMIDPQDISEALDRMEEIGIIKEIDAKYYLHKKVFAQLDEEEGNKFAEEFEEFWKLPDSFKLGVWPGAKKAALNKFIKVRKKHSLEYLLQQRNRYIELLELQPWRSMMMATVFLNMETGRFTEDFAGQIESIKNPEKKEKVKEQISIQDKKELYL